MTSPALPTLAAALVASLALTPALAQDALPDADSDAAAANPRTAPSPLPANLLIEIDDDDLIVAPFNVTVGELDGMMLFGSDESQFGEIEAVLGNAEGEVAAFAIEAGGFLGVGDREVIFPISAVQADGLRLMVDLSAADLEAHAFWSE